MIVKRETTPFYKGFLLIHRLGFIYSVTKRLLLGRLPKLQVMFQVRNTNFRITVLVFSCYYTSLYDFTV